MTSYVADAVERRATPLRLVYDFARWGSIATEPAVPEWSSPHRITLETPLMRLRDFTAEEDERLDTVPTLVIPPQAGHSSCIVDFAPSQSQINVIREAGLRRVWSLDWVGGSLATKDATIADYLRDVERAVEIIGGPVNLIGDCQGGWLATIYAALHPGQVNTLTVAGAPIDFHSGEGAVQDWLAFFNQDGSLQAYRRIVAAHGGVLPGALMLAGFVVMNPASEVSRRLQLLTNLDDQKHRDRYRQFDRWYRYTQDINGAFYLWIVEHLFANNELVKGELRVGDRVVRLSDIECPLYLMAGQKDHITPPQQVWALAEHAATPRSDVMRRLTSGGHLGLFMGREALTEHWPVILEDMARRSGSR